MIAMKSVYYCATFAMYYIAIKMSSFPTTHFGSASSLYLDRTPEHLLQKVTAYQHLVKQCTWFARDAQRKECTLRRHSTAWHAAQIGPFSSLGGEEVHFPTDLLPFSQVSDPAFLTASTAYLIDDHASVRSKHLHLHHLFLWHNLAKMKQSGSSAPSLLAVKEQCLTCTSRYELLVCLFFEVPSGYGQRIANPITISGFYNDLRANLETYLNLTLEIAIRVTDEVQRKLVYIWTAPYSYVSQTAPASLWPTTSPAGSMPVTKQLAAYWKTGGFHFEGEVIWAHIHEHRVAEVRNYVWSTTPARAGLNSAEWRMPKRNGEWRPLLLNSTEEFETHTFQFEQPQCVSTSPGVEIQKGVLIDRDDRLSCSPWTFRKGDSFTVVCLVKLRDEFLYNTIGQHCDLHLLTLPNIAIEPGIPFGTAAWPGRIAA